MTTSQILAKFYNVEIEQECKIGNIIYKHLPNQNWFILNDGFG